MKTIFGEVAFGNIKKGDQRRLMKGGRALLKFLERVAYLPV